MVIFDLLAHRHLYETFSFTLAIKELFLQTCRKDRIKNLSISHLFFNIKFECRLGIIQDMRIDNLFLLKIYSF